MAGWKKKRESIQWASVTGFLSSDNSLTHFGAEEIGVSLALRLTYFPPVMRLSMVMRVVWACGG